MVVMIGVVFTTIVRLRLVKEGRSLTGGFKPDSVGAKIVGAPNGGATRQKPKKASRCSIFSTICRMNFCHVIDNLSGSLSHCHAKPRCPHLCCRCLVALFRFSLPPTAFKGSALRAIAFNQTYEWQEVIQLQASQGTVPGRPSTLLVDLMGSGKKKKAAAYQDGGLLPGIDLSHLMPDTPTTMTVPLKREGKRGLELVGELELALNFALIDQ
eukprot:SAG31_NODE_1925_length_6893_cov_3.984987_3_plen_212_part_00